MSVDRRLVLKGMAVSGIAGLAAGGPLRTLAGTAAAPTATPPAARNVDRLLLALINEDTAGSKFLHGVAAGSASPLQVQRVERDLACMLDFERQLRNGASTRVIGLLDDASATLAVDLARSAGCRVQWLGRHSAEGGYTRHHLVTTDMAGRCSRQFGRQLHVCGSAYQITEERQGGGALALPLQTGARPRNSEHPSEWASVLGYLLATSGASQTMPAPRPSGSVVLKGSFVSFSIAA